MTTTDDFLAESASHPALLFEAIGATHKGKVIDVRKRIDTKPDGTVKTWDNGDPMHVFVFDLETDEGTRSLWVRGNLVKVLREAAQAVGVTSMIGTTITVRHHALGEAKKGFNAPKLFQAKVEPAAPAADPFSDESF